MHALVRQHEVRISLLGYDSPDSMGHRFLSYFVLTLLLPIGACSETPAYPEELAAVESFYARLVKVQEEESIAPESDWEELLEKHKVFEEWNDWRVVENAEEGNPFFIPSYLNENLVFAIACQEWQKKDSSESARWKFRSAPLNSGSHVIAALPNDQELGLRVVRHEDGWYVEQMDPVYSTKLDRRADLEEVVFNFATMLFEIEAALPASPLSQGAEGVPFIYYANRQHTRLIDSTHDAPADRSEDVWTPYWSYAIRWASAQHRAWLNGWKSEMSIYDVSYAEADAEVYLILRFTKDGKAVARPVIAQFIASKEAGGWSIDRYHDWHSHAIYEFRNDGKGNWNLEPPKRF